MIPPELRIALGRVADPNLRRLLEQTAAMSIAPDAANDAARSRTNEIQRLAKERDDRMDRHRRLAASELPVPDEDIAMLVDNRATPDGFEPLVAVQGLLADIASGTIAKPFLVLVGTTGVGKTVAAGYVIANHESVIYIRANDLIALWTSRDKADREKVRAIIRAKIVIVDEAGNELDMRRWKIVSFELVDSRQGQRRVTVFAGNVTAKEFAARLDKRTISRMQGRTKWTEAVADDRRKLRSA